MTLQDAQGDLGADLHIHHSESSAESCNLSNSVSHIGRDWPQFSVLCGDCGLAEAH